MKSLGARELTYKLMFLGTDVQASAVADDQCSGRCNCIAVMHQVPGSSCTAAASHAMPAAISPELSWKGHLHFIVTDNCSAARPQAANATTMVNIRSDEETSSDETFASFDEAHQEEIRAMVQDPDIYNRLAKSLAPAVYGHEEVRGAQRGCGCGCSCANCCCG